MGFNPLAVHLEETWNIATPFSEMKATLRAKLDELLMQHLSLNDRIDSRDDVITDNQHL